MYLEKLTIKNFRSIELLELKFHDGLNVIIGENNSGKSAIIDALRITLGYAKQWRDIGVRNDEDFYIDISEIRDTLEPIEFHLIFKVESEEDTQNFIGMVAQDPDDPTKQTIEMHFRYSLEQNAFGNNTLKYKMWAGSKEGNSIKLEEAQQIYFSYLAALRNAELELRPYAKENKVISLFKEMTSYSVRNAEDQEEVKDLNLEAKKALAAKLKQVIDDDDWTGLIKSGEKLVNEHLEKADINRRNSKVHLRLLEYEYNNIIKGILLRRPAYDVSLLGDDNTLQKFFDISQNGLGENNLIYASTVLGDLKNRRTQRKEYYYALLIEEPEAHLHPQKQNTFFNYLNNLQDLDVQIFITSHSPTLTAKSNLDNLIILQRQLQSISAFTFNTSKLSQQNKAYLRKFLDVTKSQIFFSNGAILVEGISEALLLPVFARMIGDEYDLDKNGVELVNVNGVAFEPFANLYNSLDSRDRLPSKCSIVTDNDKGLIYAKIFINQERGINKDLAKQIYNHLVSKRFINSDNRIINYQSNVNLDLSEALKVYEHHIRLVMDERVNSISERAAKANLLSSGNLRSFMAEYTFEFELLTQSEFNYRVIKSIYKTMHPKTEFSSAETINDRAIDFLEKLSSNDDKSQLAENLAFFLENRDLSRQRFVVPSYIAESVDWVVNGE